MESESEPECSSVEPLIFPCLPDCNSYWHHQLRHQNKVSPSHFVIPPPPPPKQKNPRELPPLAPNSSEPTLIRSSFDRSYNRLVPAGSFLSQGLLSSELSSGDLTADTLVFIPPADDQDHTTSGGSAPIPVCADVLEHTHQAMKNAKVHAIQINYRHPAQTVDFDRVGDILDVVSSVTNYHRNFSDVMLETAKITDSDLHFIPDNCRMGSIPVPNKEGDRVPIVAQSIFGGKKSDTEEVVGSSSDSSNVTLISFLQKETDGDLDDEIPDHVSTASISALALLKKIVKAWKDPKDAAIGNDNMCMQLMSASYMDAYRKLAKSLKKAKTDLENVGGDKQTDFW